MPKREFDLMWSHKGKSLCFRKLLEHLERRVSFWVVQTLKGSVYKRIPQLFIRCFDLDHFNPYQNSVYDSEDACRKEKEKINVMQFDMNLSPVDPTLLNSPLGAGRSVWVHGNWCKCHYVIYICAWHQFSFNPHCIWLCGCFVIEKKTF